MATTKPRRVPPKPRSQAATRGASARRPVAARAPVRRAAPRQAVRRTVPRPAPAQRAQLQQNVQHFSQEVNTLGQKAEKKIDEKGEHWDSWFTDTFGIFGPLVSTLLGLVVLGVAIWSMHVINASFSSDILAQIATFLTNNFLLFVGVFLLFSYTTYVSRERPKYYEPVEPVVTAAGLIIAVWLGARVMAIANESISDNILGSIVTFMDGNILWIFSVFIILGYVGWMLKKEMDSSKGGKNAKKES